MHWLYQPYSNRPVIDIDIMFNSSGIPVWGLEEVQPNISINVRFIKY